MLPCVQFFSRRGPASLWPRFAATARPTRHLNATDRSVFEDGFHIAV